MADKKISQLTAASTPLAGTEVLPIVQSSATVKVAVSDLTASRDVSTKSITAIAAATQDAVKLAGRAGGTSSYIATITPTTLSASRTVTLPDASTTVPVASQVLTFSGPTAARTITLPDASFTAARIDAAQSFTGDQTLATGNLIQGTAAKGFNFTANTPAAGMTSQLLNWYETGTWDPTYVTTGGSFTYGDQFGSYVRIGRLVIVNFYMYTTSATVGSGSVKLGGLPFNVANTTDARGGGAIGTATLFASNTPTAIFIPENSATVNLKYRATANGAYADLVAADLSTAGVANELSGTFSYIV